MSSYLTIVSGLPRSGTSMMMRMLEAGGMEALTDHVRTANQENPAGFYEYEPVKRTKDDPSWVEPSLGKAVKMVYQLVYDMPKSQSYRVLCMRRNMDEILASQRAMLMRSGHNPDEVSDDQISRLFNKALVQFESWVQTQPNIQMIMVSYNAIQQDPRAELGRLCEFLDGRLDLDAMVSIVDPKLYRNRR